MGLDFWLILILRDVEDVIFEKRGKKKKKIKKN